MNLDTLISDQNPQWSDVKYLPPEANWPRRQVMAMVKNWLNKRFILALTGLRRVGKSTIQKQLMSEQSIFFSMKFRIFLNGRN